MVEGSLTSYDPLAYFVNNIADVDQEVVKAHLMKKADDIERLLARGDPNDFDVFICINRGWHAFALCSPAGPVDTGSPLNPFEDIPTNDPFSIPNQLLVWETELRYEFANEKMYKIGFQLSMFGEIKDQIKKCFYIGRYKKVRVTGLQFAVLRASPKRYKVLLEDCVEFAKTFCYELLSFCDNGRDIEKSVESRLEKASGTGLSVERLSRKIHSSAVVGNSLLGGLDVSSFLSGRRTICAILVGLILLIITQILVSVIVCYTLINVMMRK